MLGDPYRLDLGALACSDTLEVFRRSPVMLGVMSAIVEQAQQLYDATIDCLDARTIDGAQGANLDVIGRIVGLWPRPLEDAGSLVYFKPDSLTARVDTSRAYIAGAPVTGLVPIGDVRYRPAIRAKIAKNHTRYGSAPELNNFALLAYGIPITVRNIGSSDVEVILPVGAPAQLVSDLSAEVTSETADKAYVAPIPSTARVTRVSFKRPNAFAPDRISGRPDYSRASISYVVNT